MFRPLLVAIALAICLPAAHATDESPRGGYVWADPDLVEIVSPTSHTSNIIYMNGCFDGCVIEPGTESSIDNRSSIIEQTANIPAFSGGMMEWDAIVECVRATYAPFEIVVTDEDPGNTPHFEAIVAGRPQDIGMSEGVGGVAPFQCGVINNAITYSFPNAFGGSVDEVCWTVAQETAHAFGLDHEYLCSDPMTYLRSCSALKRFQDATAPCGEYSARACQCGGQTQNSFQRLREHFGDRVPTPPTVGIVEPANGAKVEAGFRIEVEATDDLEVDRVELSINSRLIATLESAPFVFEVPSDLSDGWLRIRATAYDPYGHRSAQVIDVLKGEPCSAAKDCADAETCVDGRCVPGQGSDGGLGAACEGNEACLSGLCGQTEGAGVCSEQCEVGGGGCPSGYGCLDTGEMGVCWPGAEDDGGCAITASTRRDGTSLWLFLFGLLALLATRRRA